MSALSALPRAGFRLAGSGPTPVYETLEFVATVVRDLIRATRPATP
ncbi:MAG TPA: hypothetical protein VGG50_13850 [Streptosporangiaceae bacterium]|jgi:hypothetical protein